MQVSVNTELCPADLGPFPELDEGLTQLHSPQKTQNYLPLQCRIPCYPAMTSLLSLTESISVPGSITAESKLSQVLLWGFRI